METAIVSIISIALLVMGGMTISHGFLASVDRTSANLSTIGSRARDIMRTEITPLTVSNPAPGYNVQIILKNSGRTKLANFDKWDVIFHYIDSSSQYHVLWLPYTSGAVADNQWTVEGIYQDAVSRSPEVFEPGILSPGKQMIISARLNPAVKENTNNTLVISTSNGVSVSAAFAGQQ